jgi:hypothetical protein
MAGLKWHIVEPGLFSKNFYESTETGDRMKLSFGVLQSLCYDCVRFSGMLTYGLK